MKEGRIDIKKLFFHDCVVCREFLEEINSFLKRLLNHLEIYSASINEVNVIFYKWLFPNTITFFEHEITESK